MNKIKNLWTVITALALVVFISCSKYDQINPSISPDDQAKLDGVGHLFTISNDAENNTVLVYHQFDDGTIELDTSYLTGGKGLGDGLGSQGAVVLSDDHQWLFVVNAGDNTISSFKVGDGELSLAGVTSSGGVTPISLTVHQQHLYVVNTGSNDISGFMIEAGGTLTPIAGSTKPLSAPEADPAQISFRPNGKELLVTEKATNRLTGYIVDDGGMAGQPLSIKSRGKTPFGFDFSSNMNPIVSNAEAGVENASTVTSYIYTGDATKPLEIVGPLSNGQTAACWLVVAKAGESFAYITNTGSNTISSYAVEPNGVISLQQAVAAVAGVEPIDLVLSGDQSFVYNINAVSHTITAFKRNADGTLSMIEEEGGLPEFAVGLAAL